MKILITGAAGFIGMNLCQKLLHRGDQLVAVDNLNSYYDPSLKQARLGQIEASSKGSWEFHKLDISDPEALLTLVKSHPDIAVIVHLAAQAGVRYALTDPFAYARSNLLGQVAVLELVRHLPRLRRLVYASSSSVYGGNQKLPFAESDPVTHPISLYAATKGAGELLAESYSHLFQTPMVGLRFFTVYGPWGRPDMAPWLFSQAIRTGQPIRLFNHGKQSRDFTYIDDIIQGVVAAIDQPSLPDGLLHRLYNLGNNRPVELMRFIAILENCFGKKAIIDPQPMQPGDVASTWADIGRSQAELGYHPMTSIEDGLRQFTDWFQNHVSA
ncbi:MAG: NAD-dependent epimerase/dehydratase family protein [Candidatus Pacebacteria bacterium]|nr:NAD-dependent epimerase/dehydratase family protein [Candidatus Paceibacterota bacterium]